jgi:hypothetical protein
MGYRPHDQEIEPSLEKMAECIGENLPILSAAVLRRTQSRDWREGHIDELTELQKDLLDMHRRLSKLASENW